MDIFLQTAAPSDIPVIANLAHRIWMAYYPEIVGIEQTEYMLARIYSEEAIARQIGEGQLFRLIMIDGQPAGYIAVSQQAEQAYFINKFYVDNGFRGKGVGAKVFSLLLNEYPDLKELRLTVNRQNYKSINFYFKTGFIIEKCLNIDIGNGYYMEDFQMIRYSSPTWRSGQSV